MKKSSKSVSGPAYGLMLMPPSAIWAAFLAWALSHSASAQTTEVISVPYQWQYTVTGSTSTSSTLQGFYANTSGPNESDTQTFTGNVTVRLIHTPPANGTLVGTLPRVHDGFVDPPRFAAFL